MADSTTSTLATQICDHIASVFTNTTPHPPPLTVLVDEISAVASRGGRIFLHGVGREGLMLKALCMRLFHLGLSAHFVLDVTTPPISQTDLLVASVGSGCLTTVDVICSLARSAGARVLLLTAQPGLGPTWKYANSVAHLPAQTLADDGSEKEGKRSLLPMGSVYEGAMYVLFEMVVFKLGEVLNSSPEEVRSRHTNLE